jgi:hypothetical protein
MMVPKISEPIIPAEINPKSLEKKETPVIKLRATISEAPEFIPKTYGPASGLLNKVCISIPQIASELPASIAIVIRGILNSRIKM